jgi:hypothetical protein
MGIDINSWRLIGHGEDLSEVGAPKLMAVERPVVGLADALQIGRERYPARVSVHCAVLLQR